MSLAITAAVAVLLFVSDIGFLRRGVGDGIAGGLFFAIGDISTKSLPEAVRGWCS